MLVRVRGSRQEALWRAYWRAMDFVGEAHFYLLLYSVLVYCSWRSNLPGCGDRWRYEIYHIYVGVVRLNHPVIPSVDSTGRQREIMSAYIPHSSIRPYTYVYHSALSDYSIECNPASPQRTTRFRVFRRWATCLMGNGGSAPAQNFRDTSLFTTEHRVV